MKKQKSQVYYHPIHRTDGKWYYVKTIDQHNLNIGYCASIEECPECDQDDDCELCEGKGFIKHENACNGHWNALGAVHHYRESQADRANFSKSDCVERCFVCGDYTTGVMKVDDLIVYLCDKHLTREDFLSIIKEFPHHRYD